MDLSRIPILGLRQRQDEEQWFYHSDFSAMTKQIKSELRVFLRRRGLQHNWVIVDKDPQGADYITMTVQSPTGAYLPFDGRTLETLRQNFQRGPDPKKVLADLVAKETARKRATEKRDEVIAAGVADDIRYAGHVITPTVAARERSQTKVKSGGTDSGHADPAGSKGNS